MENLDLIKEMAENVKGFAGQIEDVKSSVSVVKDEMQKQIDNAFAAQKKATASKEVKFFDELVSEKMEGRLEEMENTLKKGGKFRLEMPEAKTMTISGNVTGNPVTTYSQRQAIQPAQLVNFRDLVPTVRSESGLYTFYKENTGLTNNIAAQTEGSLKGANDYSLTETKIVNSYIAGFSRFSKQMMKSLPFLSQTLPRMLQRDFFKSENASFFTTVSAAATGTTTTTETVDLKQLVQLIANQKAANFNPSFILVSPPQQARILIDTINAGYYVGSGSVQIGTGGDITIWGVPVLSATWVTDNKALVIDADYIERVEVEGIAIEFSYEDSDNFQKNLVTARIECYEAINLMLPGSAIYATLNA
jgi:HK97 family phage major capsid protein